VLAASIGLHGIQLHRVGSLPVAGAMDERAHRLAPPIKALRRPARPDELRAARRDHVNEALEIRSDDGRAPGLDEVAGPGGPEVVVEAIAAWSLARLAGRLQGLALPIPVGIGHRLQLIEQAQSAPRSAAIEVPGPPRSTTGTVERFTPSRSAPSSSRQRRRSRAVWMWRPSRCRTCSRAAGGAE
jgi:hypothetical protein